MSTYKSGISVLEISEDKAVLTINNGPKNLLSNPEFIELGILREAIESSEGLKSLIITGEGRHFSQGADTSRFTDEFFDSVSENLIRARKLLNYIENLPLVTVAAINGGCFGGGLEIALSCQFRICSGKAVFGMPETELGVIPGMSGVERLARLIGRSKAISLVLKGNIFSSAEALELGIVDFISENKNCLEDAEKFVSEITENRSVLQIRSVTERVSKALNSDEIDSEDDSFEKLLKEKIYNN